MDIPSTVAGYGGPPSKEPPVSSLEGRSVESRTPHCPSIAEPACDTAHIVSPAAEDMATRAASNAGQWRWWPVASGTGGGAGERGQPAAGVGSGRAGASGPGGGVRPAVRRRRVLPGRGQGAGEVRDAARARAGRDQRDRGGVEPRLLPSRLLPCLLYTSPSPRD